MISSSWTKNTFLRNERLLHVGMAVVMLSGVIGCFVVHGAISQYVDRIALDTEECAILQSCEHEFTEAVIHAQQRQEQLENEYRSMLDRIPAKIVDSEILSSIRRIATSSQCNMLDFRPIATQSQKEFQTRSFDLHLEGRFKSLFQFFETLRRVPYVYQVSRFKVSESSTPSGLCRLDLELKVVFDHIWAQPE